MSTLEEAIAIAAQAHAGAKDKAGEPYILHPLRVMLKTQDPTEQIVAVLHDVVEDSSWTRAALRERGFTEEILDAVDCLTRRPEESYEEFVRRASQNPIARRVKVFDLEDNLDQTRMIRTGQRDPARVSRYEKALEFLKKIGGTR
jgi:(p)ppGpp synthase/HD superfamily hydrolase